MRTTEPSEHLVKVVAALRGAAGEWLSGEEIGRRAGVAQRTARAHAVRLERHGLIEVARVFPGHRYRWLARPSKEGAVLLAQIDEAARVFAR